MWCVFMGLFNKKSDEQKMAENRINELCGGFLGNDRFKDMLEKNNLDNSTPNINYVRDFLASLLLLILMRISIRRITANKIADSALALGLIRW